MQTPGTTYLVLPGPLRRIVARRCSVCRLTLTDYWYSSTQWSDVGLVNAEGHVVRLDAPPRVLADLRDCEPIRGVLSVHDHDEVAP